MVDVRREFGNSGEALAASFLVQKGYEILERQYRCVYGELDLVCRQGDEIVFVEVKARNSNEFGYPEDSVTPTKRRHLLASTEEYLETHRLLNKPWRVDVIAIEFQFDPPRISHFEAIDIPEHF